MALNPTTLTQGIKAAFIAAGAADNASTNALASGLANAIITEITTNAEVQPTLLIAPGGLTPAPVTGTGKVA